MTVTDMPALWTGGAAACSSATRTVWCRLPAGWFVDGVLAGHRRRQVADVLCPERDGRFPVVAWREERLTSAQAEARPWRAEVGGALIGTEQGRVRVTDLAVFA